MRLASMTFVFGGSCESVSAMVYASLAEETEEQGACGPASETAPIEPLGYSVIY